MALNDITIDHAEPDESDPTWQLHLRQGNSVIVLTCVNRDNAYMLAAIIRFNIKKYGVQ